METRVIPPKQASARQTELGDRFNRVLFEALDVLQEKKIPYALIGGIAASGLGRPRSTHDIDIFVRPEDAEAALNALEQKGFETERTDPRWLFKGWRDEMMVDIIFKSQGDIYFDDEMYRRTQLIHYHGRDIPAVSPEDLIIIKGAVHSEVGPHHWHDALAILSHANLNWEYLIKRSRRAPRRLLALLIYAQSNDIWIPNSAIFDLFRIIFGDPFADVGQGKSGSSFSGQSAQRSPRAEARPGKQARTTDTTAASETKEPDTYLIGHIHEALATEPRTATLDVQIVIGGKRILANGEAQTSEQRRAIEEVIRRIAKGFEVDNQVRITEFTASNEIEEVV